MTACGWWAVDDRHRCYLYRELAQPDLILSEAAKTIIERSPAEEMYRYTVASPDLWNRRQDTGFAGEEILYKSGLKGLIKADDRRVPGWQAMYEHMMPVEMKQEDGSIKESPHFFVFDTCTYFISTVPTLIRDDIDPNDINRKSTNDHMAESARYFIMSRPPLSLTEEQKKERKDRQERRNSHNIRSNITGV
jgi:phage terminase large subunit